MTKICIFGAGAIGGYIATCLKKTDAEISLIARGPHKKAIEEKGLTFIKNDKSENFKFNITADPKTLDIQDYIFVSVKAHSISNIVDNLSPIISDQTSIISAVNGLPWWYFYKSNTGTNLDDKYIESVDPNGKIWNTFKPERAIGCVVYPACEITEPGVIKHNEGESLLIAGGLKVPQKKNLRDEIWIKLWGNCSFNPVSALTNKTLDEIGNDKKLIDLVRKLMEECQMVGEKIGVKFNVSIDDRIKGATSVIGHKPSTTQDLNAGKPLEIDPIIGSIIEIANKLKVETPNLKKINSDLKLKAENLGLYQRSKLIDDLTS